MFEGLNISIETRRKLEELQRFRLDELAGYCPVQASGEFEGCYWYFRARGNHWSIEVGGIPDFTLPPHFWHEEEWGDQEFAAGYMTDQEAISCVLKGIDIYRSTERVIFSPESPEWESHVLSAWSARMIGADKAAALLSITVIDVVERAKAVGFEEPWTAKFEVENYQRKVAREEAQRGAANGISDES